MRHLALFKRLLLPLLVLAACAGPPDLIVGIDNPEIPAQSLAGVARHKVFITSTREDTEVVGALFSDLRSDELGLASVTVTVPPNHVVGNLERPRRLPPDPRREFAIVEPTVFEADRGFLASLNSELRARAPGDRSILFFVHGYNTTTADAILQVGQFVQDSGFKGVPVLFTWASAGKLTRYVFDLNSALIARPKLIDAGELISQSIAQDYHLFAHSMGGFLTMEAIVDATQTGDFGRTGRLRTVVFASPDIDIDLFRSQMAQVGPTLDNFFVLLSQDDYALRASRWIAGGVPRVGSADAEELAKIGVTAIDLSEIKNTNSSSHSKFTGSPEVVQLIGQGLNENPRYGAGGGAVLDDLIDQLPIRVVPSGG